MSLMLDWKIGQGSRHEHSYKKMITLLCKAVYDSHFYTGSIDKAAKVVLDGSQDTSTVTTSYLHAGKFEVKFNKNPDSDALSRTLQERFNVLVIISEEKSRADSEIETLKSNLEMCENEIKSLKYEVHVVSRELEIRNEEKNMCIRSADAANKQHLEGVKKIAKLEAECQRLRSLVRKKLPGPAALAQTKLEVESLGGGVTRLKRSPSKGSSPCKLACLLNQKPEDSPAVVEFRNRLSKVLESVSADADVGKIVEDVKCILQDVNVCVDHDKPSDVQGIHQDLKTAVSRIHEFVLLLRTGEDTVTEGNDLVELINGFTITFDHVLSGVKKLDDFVSDLANVFNEAMELKVTFRGLTSSEVETVSPDCIEKVVLPESKAIDKD
ncbi:unnamed protein product [Brassica napus]|nr:unnamed protein product [Brassica napus]